MNEKYVFVKAEVLVMKKVSEVEKAMLDVCPELFISGALELVTATGERVSYDVVEMENVEVEVMDENEQDVTEDYKEIKKNLLIK